VLVDVVVRVLKGMQMTLFVGREVPELAGYDLINALTSLEVTTDDAGASGFQLRFGLTNRSMLRQYFMVDQDEAIPYRRVVVVVTLHGVQTVLMDGITTDHQFEVGGSGGQAQLVVTGEDLTALMNRQPYTRAHENLSIAGQVETILGGYSKYGIQAKVVAPAVNEDPAREDRIPTQNGSDLDHIRQVAHQVGHVFHLEFGQTPKQSVAYWGPPERGLPVQPKLTVDMGPHTNVESLNFRYDTQRNRKSAALSSNVKSRRFDPTTASDADRDQLSQRLGRLTAPAVGEADGRPWSDGLSKLSPQEVKQRTAAHEARVGEVVSGSGSLNVLRYGHILKARQTVAVRGTGEVFNGVHYVRSVTHQISRGEYKQSFQLSRNALMADTAQVGS
jgi:hypothetical protein